jgi:16S rRNA (cytosine1402-N4)-methyltransferase
MMTANLVHIPVLLAEVLHEMAPRDSEVLVDGTFGAGGYSRALLDSAACTVWGIDRDPAALERARPLEAAYAGRLRVLEGRFGDMADLLAAQGVAQVDAIVLDIGVSSPQIDTPERGFSFRFDGPLDMRMGADGPTAADVVNTTEEDDLANILYHYGEERLSRRVARAIVARRAIQPFTRTADLADVIRSCVPKSKDGIDPATRSFQGLRIHVNDELGELERALVAAERLLAPGGRLCVVTFHSLEDRVVKEFMRQRSGNVPGPSRHVPGPVATAPAPTFRLLSKSGTAPGKAEQAANPRARSARLRTAIRTQAPTWSTGEPV